jgi:hypothetical protein
MRLVAVALCLAALFTPLSAHADVAAATPTSFLIQAEADVSATPDQVWRRLARVESWWSDGHTYSGDASNLSLQARAGGCWCERWDGQSVEHGRVVMAMNHEGVRTLRVNAALGPLQDMGATGVLTFTIAPLASGAKITMTYRVSGDVGLGLDQVAPHVDLVMMEQFTRLSRLSAPGSPN